MRLDLLICACQSFLLFACARYWHTTHDRDWIWIGVLMALSLANSIGKTVEGVRERKRYARFRL